MDSFFELKDIHKDYPGVKALDGVSLSLREGEVHALLGENGAGKSTLIKIVSGAITPTSGKIVIYGQEYSQMTPAQSVKLGIGVIYQEFTLVPTISVYENMFLGNEIRKSNLVVDKKKMIEETKNVFSRLGISIDPLAIVRDLSVAEQQLVEIAKAISRDVKILIMDEPSAPLTEKEVDSMLALVRKLKARGVTIIYISHRMEELFSISDRITVLRDGQYIDTLNTSETNVDELISLMIGRSLENRFPQRKGKPSDEIVLSVSHLRLKKRVRDVSFELHKGEILGLFGLVGAGRTETVRAIFGADPIESGKVYIDGEEVSFNSPLQAIKSGLALLPEDRKNQGVIVSMSVKENSTLACPKRIVRSGVIRKKYEDRITDEYINKLKIKTPSRDQLVRNLSGGNQQKVVLAKWLASEAKIIIVDEPTRGIDVLAKHEIYSLLNDLADSGIAILMISSEMPELIGVADRVVVMYEGAVSGELRKKELTQDKIMHLASIDKSKLEENIS